MEKPIIFSTPMVKAILAGKKSITRRVIKKKYENTDIEWFTNKYGTRLVEMQNDAPSGVNSEGKKWTQLKGCREIKCPYGQPGDILWVRETWAIHDLMLKPKKLNPNNEAWFYKRKFSPEMVPHVVYAADYPIGSWKGAWRSSRYMPKVAARLFLKVKDIRVERLQGITEEDAEKEGSEGFWADKETGIWCSAKDNFRVNIWDSINSKRGYGWDINPWVWVVEFERVEV